MMNETRCQTLWSHHYVTALCGVLDGLLEESDDTTNSGRILVAAMVVKVYSNMALQFMIDLGFVDLLRCIQEGENRKHWQRSCVPFLCHSSLIEETDASFK
jgi:hypothetical protein